MGKDRVFTYWDDTHSLLWGHQPIELAQILAREAQLVEVEIGNCLRAIEQAQHDPLAVRAWNRRHTDIDIASCDTQPDTSILRKALLRDVEAGHDFDTRSDGRLNLLGW